MSHSVYFVAEKLGCIFPRWTIMSIDGRYWNAIDGTWSEDLSGAALYADLNQAAVDCAALQRRNLNKPIRTSAQIPLQVEVHSDQPVDYEALKLWLTAKIQMSLDIAENTGPTPDAIVFVSVEWGQFRII